MDSNPFGITQIDVPGLLSTYTGMRRQNLQDQYTQAAFQRQQTQDARADEEYQLEKDKRAAMANLFTPPAAAPGGAPGALVDPAYLPARTDGVSLNPDALRKLYTLDPTAAFAIQSHIHDADKQALEAIQLRGTTMARIAGGLKSLPINQRAAALQQAAPELQAVGYTPQQLAQTDLSDAGLDKYFATGKTMEQIIAEDKAKADDARQAAQDAETARHNRSTEGTAAGNLKVNQSRVGLANTLANRKTPVGGMSTADLLALAGGNQ